MGNIFDAAFGVEFCDRRALCRVRRDNWKYGGYKKCILRENMTKRDEVLLICEICKGIMSEPCISESGGQFCSGCSEEINSPNVLLRERIGSLKCSCPLLYRGCGWLGTLNDCEKHLEDMCDYVHCRCPTCEELQKRNEIEVHMTECLERTLKREEFQSRELRTHLGICPEVEIYKQMDLCRVERMEGVYGGYRKDILKENLTKRDRVLLICEICKGIMREASMSGSGEQFCSSCDVGTVSPASNVTLRRMISLLKCCCPLVYRGCDWLGTLNDCEAHLETCGYVYDLCLGCEELLQRNELKFHEKENCPQRIVECEHCRKDFKSCELPKHLDECPKMEVSCKLCDIVMCRVDITQHLEQECGLVVETCKLGCGVELTRDELKIHVTDTCVQREIPCEHCEVNFKYCDMTNHLDVCPRMEVSCELCDIVMCREDMTQHLEEDCVEKEIDCPFVKYKCEVGLIKRKYLTQHLEEKRTEHLELKLTETELKLTETELKLTAMKLELTGKETIETVEKQSIKIRETIKTSLYVCLSVCVFVFVYTVCL